MKNTMQKIALITLIIAGGIFIVLMFTIGNWATVEGEGTFISPFTNPIVLVFLIILSVLYVGVSVYLLWAFFSEDESVKKILLYRDSNSTANTTYSVAKRMIKRSANQLGTVRISKVKIRHADNLLILNVVILVKSREIEHTIDTLRCMIADIFYSVLGVKFDSINLEVKKVVSDYEPSIPDAEQKASQLKAQRVAKQKVEDDIPEEEEQIEQKAEEIAVETQEGVFNEVNEEGKQNEAVQEGSEDGNSEETQQDSVNTQDEPAEQTVTEEVKPEKGADNEDKSTKEKKNKSANKANKNTEDGESQPKGEE